MCASRLIGNRVLVGPVILFSQRRWGSNLRPAVDGPGDDGMIGGAKKGRCGRVVVLHILFDYML